MNVNQKTNCFSKSLFRLAACTLLTTGIGIGQVSAHSGITEKASSEAAQQAAVTIKGRVVDEKGEGLVGVNIKEKGTSNGTITNSDGTYVLDAKGQNSVIVFSYVGYASQEIIPENGKYIKVTLKEDSKLVDEVVVIGYGTQRKGDVTSAVTSVKAENFTFGNAQDAAALIKGQVAGLSITNGSGDPNATSNIVLRGIATLNGTTTPLILVDGVPGDVSTVAPESIESIDVLKDASAAAIYGTRGANGVIIITTKKGKREQKTELNYSSYLSTSGFYKQSEFMSAEDVKNGKTAFTDLGSTTDWVKAVTQMGFTQNHSVSLTGGGTNSVYSAGLTYRDQDGVIKKTNSKDIKGTFDLTQYMLNNIAKLNINYVVSNHSNNVTTATDDGITNIYRQALIHNPTAPVYNSDGTYYENFNVYQYYNPVAILNEKSGENKTLSSQITTNLTVEPIKGWQTNIMLSRNTTYGSYGYYNTQNYYSSSSLGLNGSAYRSDANSRADQLEITSKYMTVFGKSRVSALVGYSYNYNVYEGGSSYNYDFPTDAYGYNNISAGAALKAGNASISSYKNDNKLIGYFGRISYAYDDKYNLLLSVRREGSSKFGDNNKWGTFPSASVGWTISKEPFMKDQNWISNLKLRSGYGVTGEIPSSSYLSLTTYTYGTYYYSNGSWVSGLSATTNPNPDLKWEKSAEFNLGLDISVLKDRLGATVDFYNKNTSDMLWSYNVPTPPNLYGTTLANVGKMRNTGIEIAINASPIKTKDFEWKTTVTASHNDNKLVSLSNDLYETTNYLNTGYAGDPISLPTHRLEVGKSLGNFWGLKTVGISDNGLWLIENPKTGEAEEFNANMLNDDYRQYLGNGIPKLIMGWNNQFKYKNFDLSLSFNGQFGYKILNEERMFYENNSISYNRLKSAANLVYGKRTLSSSQSQTFVSYYLENGDFVKLNNVTFGYNFNTNKLKLVKKIRLYVTGENLFCITGYSGLDPELTNSDIYSYGNDSRDKYPTIRSFTFGLNITLN
jgi:TonB-dependent starch-binding outer membrane protein SusC